MKTNEEKVTFQVLKAIIMKMVVFRDMYMHILL